MKRGYLQDGSMAFEDFSDGNENGKVSRTIEVLIFLVKHYSMNFKVSISISYCLINTFNRLFHWVLLFVSL